MEEQSRFTPAPVGDIDALEAAGRAALGIEDLKPIPNRDYSDPNSVGFTPVTGGGPSLFALGASAEARAVREESVSHDDASTRPEVTETDVGDWWDSQDQDDAEDDGAPALVVDRVQPVSEAEPVPLLSEQISDKMAEARQRLSDVMENRRIADGRHDQLGNIPALDQAVKQARAELSDLDYSLSQALRDELAPGLNTSTAVSAAIAELERYAEDAEYEARQLEAAGRPLRAADVRAEAKAKLGDGGIRRLAELKVALEHRRGQELVAEVIEKEAKAAVEASFASDVEKIRQIVSAKSGKEAGEREANLFKLRIAKREPSEGGRVDEYTSRLNAARLEAQERFDRNARAKHLESGAFLER